MKGMTEILLLDDHQVVGQGTKSMIETHPGFYVMYVSDHQKAIEISESKPFDLYVLDMNLSEAERKRCSEKRRTRESL